MATTKPGLLTANDLLRLYSEGVRGELIMGVLFKTMPAGGTHGRVAGRLIYKLMEFVDPQGLGTVVGTDSGVLLQRNPDIVREPDVAFFTIRKLPLDADVPGYFEIVPDLAVEIASPGITNIQLNDKCRMWLSYGVPMVWEVHPAQRIVRVHQPDRPAEDRGEGADLEGGAIIPGFRCPVGSIFGR